MPGITVSVGAVEHRDPGLVEQIGVSIGTSFTREMRLCS
jgi:hypothetical protein